MSKELKDASAVEVAKELSEKNENFRPIYDGLTYVEGKVFDAKVNLSRKNERNQEPEL